MYVDAMFQKDSDVIKVVERLPNGSRAYKEFPPRYTFYTASSKGKYRSIYGEPLDRVVCKSTKEFRKEIAMGSNLHEADLKPVIVVLAEHYQNIDPPKLNVAWFDIEVDMQPYAFLSTHTVKTRPKPLLKSQAPAETTMTVFQLGQLENKSAMQVYDEAAKSWVSVAGCSYLQAGPGYASTDDAYLPITAISVHLQWLDTLVTFALPPKHIQFDDAVELVSDIPNVLLFKSEAEMLNTFLSVIEDADVLSGWNSEGFDIPYTVNRVAKVLSKDDTRRFCLWDQLPKRREYEKFGKTAITYDLIGRIHLDSLELYRKYNYEERHTYRLDAIGELEVGERKVEYDGTLDQLYNNDFKRFIQYNRQDTALLDKLDKKLKFLDLANAIAHENTVLLPMVTGAVAVTEQAIINEAHRRGMRVPNRNDRNKLEDTQAAGAYVAYPKKGLHDWVGSLDINSLYPSVIRALNMSPETIVGQLRQTDTDAHIAHLISKGSSFAAAWEGMFNSLEYDIVMKKDIGNSVTIDWEDGREQILSGREAYHLLFESNKPYMLSANGTIFTHEIEGVIPGLLKRWYAERKMLQAELKATLDLSTGVTISNELIAALS